MPRDRAIKCQINAGREAKALTGHNYLRDKLSHRDVSCTFFKGPLHFTQLGFLTPTAAGVVVEKGSKYILAHQKITRVFVALNTTLYVV